MVGQRRIIVAVLAFMALVAAVVSHRWTLPEPVYLDEPLSYWLQGYQERRPIPPGLPDKTAADDAVRWIGTNAIPSLVRKLEARDGRFERAFFSWLDRQRFLTGIPCRVPAWEKNRAGMEGLEALGAAGGGAIPGLIEIYDEGNWECQQSVVNIFAQLGPAATNAVPTLLRALANSNPVVRFDAAYALAQIHGQPDVVVPALTIALKDPLSSVRGNAAAALGCFGRDAQSALPALLQLLPSNNLALPASGFDPPSPPIAGPPKTARRIVQFSGPSLVWVNPDYATNFATSLASASGINVNQRILGAVSRIDPTGELRKKVGR